MANTPMDAPMGQGMARMSANKIQLQKEYQKHVISAQENGDEPMKYEDWLAQRKQDQQAGYDSAK